MAQCPRCSIDLENSNHVYGNYPQCSNCHGVLMGWALFKNNTDHEMNRDMWAKALQDDIQSGTCKTCGFPLRVTEKSIQGNKAVLNICNHCFTVWIDGSNLEETARALPMVEQKEDQLPNEAKALLAVEMITSENKCSQISESFSEITPQKQNGHFEDSLEEAV